MIEIACGLLLLAGLLLAGMEVALPSKPCPSCGLRFRLHHDWCPRHDPAKCWACKRPGGARPSDGGDRG